MRSFTWLLGGNRTLIGLIKLVFTDKKSVMISPISLISVLLNVMKKIASILCFLWFCGISSSFAATQNLYFLTGKDTALTEGDMYHRAVFYLELPENLTETVYLRIFDADLAGAHDRWEDGSEVRYRVYGKGALDWTLRTITDPLPSAQPLADLSLAENKFYDDRWRTLIALNPADAESKGQARYFQLVVDGLKGSAINKYQVFASAQEKENKAINGLRMFSPAVMLYLPTAPAMATQLRFEIPAQARYLEIFNFDADLIQKQATLHFETQFTQNIPIDSSKDGETTSTKVTIGNDEQGQTGALVLRNPKQTNQIQLWIADDKGETVFIALPAFTAAENHLPIPDIKALPLSECLSMVLDASGSTDPDNDELDFEWLFPDGTRVPGSRIVHDFERAGNYPVTLFVRDQSGFVANSSQLTQTIHINEAPTAVIKAIEKTVPQETVVFDASGSSDADGAILKYLWNFDDGTKAEGQTVEHSYSDAGYYEVTLTVEDDSQSLCKQTRSTHDIFVNKPPVPRLNLGKTIAAVAETITLNAEGSIDSDGEIVEYAWDFGDTATASGEEVTHAWQAPGTYTIRMRVTDDADLSNSAVSEEAQIVINAPPVAQAESRQIIAAQEETLFDGALSSDPDGTIRKYVWNMGDGAEKEGEKITHAYAKPGLYTVRLAVTDNTDTANNTTDTTFEVRVNQPPVPMAGEDQVVNASLVKFDASASSDTDDPIIDYVWDFGDGTSQQGKTVSHVYALPGTYTATLTVTDASQTLSAKQSDTVQITVNHPPIADAGGSQVVSPGEKFALDGSFSTDPDGKITTYAWKIGENGTLDGARGEYQFEQPGKYQVRLTVTDNVGATGVDYATITVNAPPIADFYPIPRVAPGQNVKFDGSWSHDPDGTISRAAWVFGDNTPPQVGLITEHSFAASGRYNVTLAVDDDSSASAHSAEKTRVVEVNYPPKAEAGSDIRTCEQKVRFDASQSVDPDSDTLNYFWDFGDGERGQGRSVEHTYAKPGIYPVNLTVDDGQKVSNSTAYATLTAYVNAPPVADLRLGRPSVCAGELALFDASQSSDLEKGRLRYVWDLGDGVPVEGINPVREYAEGGDYRIRLKVSDDSGLACNTTETETMLHVVDAPIARAGDDQTVCANSLVEFDGAASTGGGRRIKSYEWEFGDGQFGVGVNPGHVYAEAGDYTVRLLITVAGDGECSNVSEDEVVIHVMAAPVAMFDAPKAACVGESLAFDASASTSSNGKITEFSWDFGDNTSATGATASHAYQTPGAYRAALRLKTDAAGVCNASEYTETIVINAVPTPVIQVASADQEPVTGESYATELQMVLRFSGATSSDTDGYVADYRWDFGDGAQASGAFASHQYETPGDYPVTLEVTDNSGTSCQKARSTLLVQVRKPQIQAIVGPDSVCVGQPATYKVSGESAEWQINDGTTATGKELQQTFERPGTYQIQAKVGADWMPVKEVTALELPELRLPERLDVFLNDSAVIQPVYDKSSGLPLLFQWDMGDGATLDAERAGHIYTEPGDHAVRLLLTMPDAPECLQKTYTIPVTVHTPPQVEIETDPKEKFAGGARDAITFHAALQSNAAEWNYRWNFGDDEEAQGQSVSHAYRQSGTYQVTVTLSDALLRTWRTYTHSQEIEVKPR